MYIMAQLNKLEKYMFKSHEIKCNETHMPNIPQANLIKISSNTDPFFEIFRALRHGQALSHGQSIKIAAVEKCPPTLRVDGGVLKKKDVEQEILHAPAFTLHTLQIVCVLYELNVLVEFVAQKKFCQIIGVPGKPFHGIVRCQNKMFILQKNPSTWAGHIYLAYLKEVAWEIDNVTSELNRIATYALSDLQHICDKLQLPIVDACGKTFKKIVLYANILHCKTAPL